MHEKQLVIKVFKTCIVALAILLAFISGSILANGFTSPSVYLDDLPSTATYTIKTDGSYYWAVRYDGVLLWESTNDDTVLQNAINTTNSLGGGSVYVKAGTYSASVTIKQNVLLVLEAGVSGVTYTVDSGGYCIRYADGYAWFEQPLNMTGHEVISGAFHTGTAAPSNPNTGQWWYDTNTYNLKIYNGTDWATVQGAQGPTGASGLGGLGSYDYIVYQNGSYTQARDNEGTLAYNSTNEGTVINSVIDDANGGDVYLASGTFTLPASTGIDADQVGTHLHGAGYDTVIAVSGTFADHIIHVAADYVTISDLRIDGTGQTASYDGIVEDGNGNGGLIVHHVTVQDCGRDGIRLGDEDSSWEGNWAKIHHVVSKDNGQYGIHFTYDATDSELMDFLVSGHDGVGDAGINVGCDNIRINTGHLWGNEYEMKIAEDDYDGRGSVNGLIVSNVGFMDGGSQGQHRIYHDGEKNFINSGFSGCEFWVAKLSGTDTYDGFHLSGDTWCISITGCVFRGDNEADTKQGRYGIFMDASVHNCTIIGNTFEAFVQSDPIETSAASDITEVGNIVYNCG